LSERGDHPVERLPLRQWLLKITKYADRLEAGLEGLDWPAGTMTAQKQWIGKSTGTQIVFPVEGNDDEVRINFVNVVHKKEMVTEVVFANSFSL
jgi:leucyl-tRNA synthetase